MTKVWDDPRVQRGLAAQNKLRQEKLAAGAKVIGWKASFGTPAGQQRFGITGAVAGFLTDASRVASGGRVSLAGWAAPKAEPEIAVHLGRDLGGGADRAGAAAAIAAVGPAIELVDMHPAPLDIEGLLSGNIYHRHVLLGPADTSRAGAKLDGLKSYVLRNGAAMAEVTDLTANSGDIPELIRQLADYLAATGERLRAGQVVICGSLVAPVELGAQDTSFGQRLAPIGEVSVQFTR
jgi:2-keto-4-pentenoate hydratase